MEKSNSNETPLLSKIDDNKINITIVENIQENNYFESYPANGRVEIKSQKTVKKRSLNGYLLILGISLLLIIIYILYLSFDINLAFWDKSTTNTSSKVPTYSLQSLNAPEGNKPVHIEQKCYGFTVPYAILKSTQRGTCGVFVSLRTPKGNVTVDYRIKESGDVLPDITMRRLYKDKYLEIEKMIDDTKMVIFQNVSIEGFEKTAFFDKGNAHIAITLKTEVVNKDRDQVFEGILKSFYCKDGCKYQP